MPCSDYGEMHGPCCECQSLKARLDRVTRFLCGVLRDAEQGRLPDMPHELRVWWNEHKAMDAEREKREREAAERLQRRNAALAKLNPAERRLLGLCESSPS